MKTPPTKKASEIKAGDKIYTTEKANTPSVVTASYELGSNWALEVEGLKQVLQVKPDDNVRVWPY